MEAQLPGGGNKDKPKPGKDESKRGGCGFVIHREEAVLQLRGGGDEDDSMKEVTGRTSKRRAPGKTWKQREEENDTMIHANKRLAHNHTSRGPFSPADDVDDGNSER